MAEPQGCADRTGFRLDLPQKRIEIGKERVDLPWGWTFGTSQVSPGLHQDDEPCSVLHQARLCLPRSKSALISERCWAGNVCYSSIRRQKWLPNHGPTAWRNMEA